MKSGLNRIWVYLLIGVITMFYAEVISGSSLLWFLKPSAILITFPFYILHTVFFLNIAIKFNRKNLLSLYFLGILYGLYEAWFTTVILYGYLNKTPVFGAFLGISIWEFLVLVFFWHPVMSFILSVTTFEILSTRPSKDVLVTPGSIINSKRPLTYIVWLVLFVIGASVISLYSGFDTVTALGSYVGSVALIFVFYLVSKKYDVLSIKSLILGQKSLIVLGIIIPVLYILGFLFHSGGAIVDYRALVFVFSFYIFASLLFYFSKYFQSEKKTAERLESKKLWLIYAIGALLVIADCVFYPVLQTSILLLFVSIAFIGLSLFVVSLILAAKMLVSKKQ